MVDVERLEVLLRGKTFLYIQKAPFTPSGMSILGGLEYDRAEDKIRCHECGDWFHSLAPLHLKTHDGMTAGEYKRKHGLRRCTALLAEGVRSARCRATAARFHADPKQAERLAHLIAAGARKQAIPVGLALELRKERNSCPAQLPVRIRKLAETLGRTPTAREFAAAGISLQSACLALNVENTRALLSLCNLRPNNAGWTPLTRQELIERLRDFWARFNRLPGDSDARRGLIPSRTVFRRVFGGMRQAFKAAGLGLVTREAA